MSPPDSQKLQTAVHPDTAILSVEADPNKPVQSVKTEQHDVVHDTTPQDHKSQLHLAQSDAPEASTSNEPTLDVQKTPHTSSSPSTSTHMVRDGTTNIHQAVHGSDNHHATEPTTGTQQTVQGSNNHDTATEPTTGTQQTVQGSNNHNATEPSTGIQQTVHGSNTHDATATQDMPDVTAGPVDDHIIHQDQARTMKDVHTTSSPVDSQLTGIDLEDTIMDDVHETLGLVSRKNSSDQEQNKEKYEEEGMFVEDDDPQEEEDDDCKIIDACDVQSSIKQIWDSHVVGDA